MKTTNPAKCGGLESTEDIILTALKTVDGVDLSVHAADTSAHHPAEVAIGRGYYGTTTLLSIPGISPITLTTVQFSANIIYYFPITIHTPKTINQVTFEVTTAATSGKKCRIAIYAANTNWQPGTLQIASAELAIDANAVINGALTATTLTAGLYLIALTLQEAATLRVAQYSSSVVGFLPALGASAFPYLISVAASYAQLPTTGTAWDTATSGSQSMPYPIFLRESTP